MGVSEANVWTKDYSAGRKFLRAGVGQLRMCCHGENEARKHSEVAVDVA